MQTQHKHVLMSSCVSSQFRLFRQILAQVAAQGPDVYLYCFDSRLFRGGGGENIKGFTDPSPGLNSVFSSWSYFSPFGFWFPYIGFALIGAQSFHLFFFIIQFSSFRLKLAFSPLPPLRDREGKGTG